MQEQNEFQPSFADPTQPMEAEERTFYRNSTRDLVSRVAYLIGVPKRMFENEHEPPQLDIYDRLDKEKNARIIRNLCLIRTAIQRNFKYINEGMRFEHRSILTMPEYVPVESINQLELDGVRFIKKSSIKLYQHIIEINRVISDRINNCKPLFPLWLNWEYIRDLIVMPDGLTEAGTKAAATATMPTGPTTPIRSTSTGSPPRRATSSTTTSALPPCCMSGTTTGSPSTAGSPT